MQQYVHKPNVVIKMKKIFIFFSVKSAKINNEEGVLTKSLISTAFKITLFYNMKNSWMVHLSQLFVVVLSLQVDKDRFFV